MEIRSLRRAARVGTSGCQTPEDDTALAALEHVIAAYGRERLAGTGQRRAADRALRGVARRLAAEARAADPVRAERLLVDLRRAWQGMPAVRQIPDSGPRRALWDRLVRLCCEEFYGRATMPPDADAAPARPEGPAPSVLYFRSTVDSLVPPSIR